MRLDIPLVSWQPFKSLTYNCFCFIGAIHDCNSQSCPCTSKKCSCCSLSNSECSAGGAYIMNPTSNSSVEKFSPCSINTICSSLSSVATCLSGKFRKPLNILLLIDYRNNKNRSSRPYTKLVPVERLRKWYQGRRRGL